MEFVYHAHSGLRYLVIVAAALAIAYLAYGWATRRPWDRAANGLTAAFSGLLDTQIVLGIVLLFLRPFYGALTGHVVMMLLAAGAAHGLKVAGRRSPDPRRRYALTLAGVVLALALVVGGIAAIGRGVFQMTVS